jgi:hypothetical protein
VFPDLDRGKNSIKHPLTYIPYRSILPKGVDNLLVACRAFSSDQETNNFFNLIPHCIAIGEAAGTAAALALDQNVAPRNVDIEYLKKQLIKQNVILPENIGKNRIKDPKAYTFKKPRFGSPQPGVGPKVEH